MKTNRIITGEALEELKKLPDESIDCVMTSPPYWGLRDYGTATWTGGDSECDHVMQYRDPTKPAVSGGVTGKRLKDKDSQTASLAGRKYYRDKCGKCGAISKDQQLGLEPDFRDYIKDLADIFDEVKRVLKKTGTCWVNLGDTYGGSKDGNTEQTKNPKVANIMNTRKAAPGLEKSLIQIPSRFSIAMTDRGWILRNEIIWYKKNVMPSSVKDRFTVDFEKIFFFTKNKKYYFEQEFEPLAVGSDVEYRQNLRNAADYDSKQPYKKNFPKSFDTEKRNKRTVWQINPQPFSEAHFAVFPPKLVETPIKSGCPEQVCKKCGQPREKKWEYTETPTRTGKGAASLANDKEKGLLATQGGTSSSRPDVSVYATPKKQVGWNECNCKAGFQPGVVLDPFFGSGTTALVAEKLNRKWLGIELNPEYVKIAEKRLGQQGLGI